MTDAQVESVRTMFAELDVEVIKEVLQGNNGDMEKTIDQLLSINATPTDRKPQQPVPIKPEPQQPANNINNSAIAHLPENLQRLIKDKDEQIKVHLIAAQTWEKQIKKLSEELQATRHENEQLKQEADALKNQSQEQIVEACKQMLVQTISGLSNSLITAVDKTVKDNSHNSGPALEQISELSSGLRKNIAMTVAQDSISELQKENDKKAQVLDSPVNPYNRSSQVYEQSQQQPPQPVYNQNPYGSQVGSWVAQSPYYPVQQGGTPYSSAMYDPWNSGPQQ